MRLECLTCHGVYDDVQADGLRYFHTCPPLSIAEVTKAVQDGRVQLPRGESAEDACTRRVYERTAKRDERLVQPADSRAAAVIVSAGRGVRAVPASDDGSRVVVVPD